MDAKILISTSDVENIHKSCIGTLFSIKGVKDREFTCNKAGYVHELVRENKPFNRFELSSYFATQRLKNKLNGIK